METGLRIVFNSGYIECASKHYKDISHFIHSSELFNLSFEQHLISTFVSEQLASMDNAVMHILGDIQ